MTKISIDCPNCKKLRAFRLSFNEHKGTGVLVPSEGSSAKCANCNVFLSVEIEAIK